MTNRTIAITGAFGALGSAVARVAGARGLRVALLDYAPAAPAGLVEACGPGAFALGGLDLSDAAKAEAAVKEAATRLGGLDALVNIAGGFASQSIAGGDPATWDKMFALNLKTAMNASRAAIPFLTQSAAGRIVNIGALAALNPAGAGMGPYTASKAAVHKLTESLAEELKGKVTVNAVLPSTLDTPANRRDMSKADFSAWVAPEEAANLILFLASPEASGVTGALIPLKGRV
jgi:NAD(P)-dependent dehydrogenase (short-subunit alcohol dehydrogenase family)